MMKEDILKKKVQKCKQEDKTLRQTFNYVQSGQLLSFGGEEIVIESAAYEIVDGLLYRKMSVDKLNKRKESLKLAISGSLKAVIVRKCHKTLLAGHLGVKNLCKIGVKVRLSMFVT